MRSRFLRALRGISLSRNFVLDARCGVELVEDAHRRAEAGIGSHPPRERRREFPALRAVLSDYEANALHDSPRAGHRIRLKSAAKPSKPDRATRSA